MVTTQNRVYDPEAGTSDNTWMQKALALANRARDLGEVPVGAVLVLKGEILGEGWNSPVSDQDPAAHAEIKALRMAARAIKNYRLPDTTLYVTLEPCPMCAGALVHARIKRIVFGTADPRSGAAGSVFNILQSTELNHRVEITGGVLEETCRDLLQSFFQAKRQK